MSEKYTRIINSSDINRWNCVKYAREKVHSLPFGLWTIGDKKKIINGHTPEEGDIAICNVGLPWGHVAVIKKVGSKHLTIREANFKYGKITERHGTTADLKIIGYFKPQY